MLAASDMVVPAVVDITANSIATAFIIIIIKILTLQIHSVFHLIISDKM